MAETVSWEAKAPRIFLWSAINATRDGWEYVQLTFPARAVRSERGRQRIASDMLRAGREGRGGLLGYALGAGAAFDYWR